MISAECNLKKVLYSAFKFMDYSVFLQPAREYISITNPLKIAALLIKKLVYECIKKDKLGDIIVDYFITAG